MAVFITDPWGSESAPFADQVHESERPEVSSLLGPDGRPLRYQPKQRIGFDLRPKEVRERERWK